MWIFMISQLLNFYFGEENSKPSCFSHGNLFTADSDHRCSGARLHNSLSDFTQIITHAGGCNVSKHTAL